MSKATSKLEPGTWNRRVCLVVLLLSSLVLLYKGILPALEDTRGDFANYYTAARLVCEGVSLERSYWDFTWFQQQMDRYGIQNQVGGFIPHPPPTALVLLPLAGLEPLSAKRVWILVNAALLLLNIVFLARIARLHWLLTAVLFLATGYGLLNNFLFGQLYLLLLASIVLCLYFHRQDRLLLSGISLGGLLPVKYFGILFLLFFAWKAERKVVLTAVLTTGIILGFMLYLDYPSFETFLADVLPRHLRGEIQDPFSVNFQSWTSMFRRLFLYEEILNPAPAFLSPLLFFLSRNLVSWMLAALAILVIAVVKFPDREHQQLFQWGWIPLIGLLLSPGSATYHFLLLTISVIFFVKILADLQRPYAALAIAVLFAAINLPHYMKLKPLAAGWLTPLAYPRLWLLLLFWVTVLFLFRSFLNVGRRRLTFSLGVAVFLGGLNTLFDYTSLQSRPDDEAVRVSAEGPEFQRHLSLIQSSPDLGRRNVVFSYCRILDDEYAIHSLDGRRLTPRDGKNYYHPDLASDDVTLLAETIRQGRTEIWCYSEKGGSGAYLVTGRTPGWHPSGKRFVFEYQGRLYLFHMDTRTAAPLPVGDGCFDPAYSPSGRSLVYCVRENEGTSLRRLDLDTFREDVLFMSSSRIESPRLSPDESKVVLAARFSSNWDIWILDLVKDRLWQLTSDLALDMSPVWDEQNSRILFTSDRGRGLGCTTLFAVALPEPQP